MKEKIKRIFSNPGSKIQIHYIRKVDSNGFPIMVENEKFNLYADIQSYAEDSNIERILEKLGGDISKLDFNKGVYIDCTKLPDNYNDLLNQTIDIANDYMKLPIKYKEALKNNYNLFYGLAMSGKVKDFINSVDSNEKSKQKFDSLFSPSNFNFNKESKINIDTNTVKDDKVNSNNNKSSLNNSEVK